MSREAGRRVFLSFAIPVGAAGFIALMLWSFSRVLLAVDPDVAPVVSLLFAMNILVGCALAAILRGRRSFLLVIGTMVVIVVGAGIAAAFVGEQPVEHHAAAGEEGEPETAGAGATPTPPEQTTPAGDASPTSEPTEEPTEESGEPIVVIADGFAFDTDTIELPADTPAAVTLDNQDDGQPHNIGIYTEEGGDALFNGEIITGPATTDYDLDPLEAGDYYFQCDVHPQMNGKVSVE